MSWTHLRDSLQHSRRDRQCCLCALPIAAGSEYVRRVGTRDGELVDMAMHPDCQALSATWDVDAWEDMPDARQFREDLEAWRREQEVGPVTWKQRALASIIEEISERCYCAGWLGGLEYELWRMVTGETACLAYGMGEVTPDELQDMRAISAEIEGWVYWHDDTVEPGLPCAEWGERFAPMAQWLEMVARRKARRKAR